MYQLENLVQEQLPDLHVHFQSQGFQTSMYASSWFLTLFTTTLNLAISCRVMDVFLSEGMEFIFKMALAMLVLGKEQLLSMDMEAMLKFFQKEIPQRIESDPESLFNLAFSMKINTKKMKKMEKEYADLKKKEQEEMVELRVMKRSRLQGIRRKIKNFCFSLVLAFEERESSFAQTKWVVGSGKCRTRWSSRSGTGVPCWRRGNELRNSIGIVDVKTVASGDRSSTRNGQWRSAWIESTVAGKRKSISLYTFANWWRLINDLFEHFFLNKLKQQQESSLDTVSSTRFV